MDGELTLAERIKQRIGQDFDGECHLTEAEANEVIRALTALPTTPSAEARETIARIIYPMDWEVADSHGRDEAKRLGLSIETSLAKADAILSSLQVEAQPVAWLRQFGPDVENVQSRFILVHQLRASADIQSAEVTKRMGRAATTDRATLMREAADAIERLAAHPSPEQAGEVERLRGEVSELRRAILGAEPDPILKHGNFLEMIRDTEAGRQGAITRAEAAEQALADMKAERALDRTALEEANPGNAMLGRIVAACAHHANAARTQADREDRQATFIAARDMANAFDRRAHPSNPGAKDV